MVLGSISDFLPRNIEVIYHELKNNGWDAIVVGDEFCHVKSTKKYSLTYFRFLLTSKYYVFTHYASDVGFWMSGGAKLINLWHGHPLKKIERDYQKNPFFYSTATMVLFRKIYHPYRYVTDFTLVCHYDYYSSVFVRAFGIDEKAVYKCKEIREVRNVGIDDFDVLYLPTFRPLNISKNHSIHVSEVIEMLEYHKISFWYKLHPVDTSIIYSTERKLCKNIDPFDTYAHASLLVTDYSSVILDFLQVNPKGQVILYLHDEEQYVERDRGFYPLWEDIKNECIVVKTNDELSDAIENCLQESTSKIKLNLKPLDNQVNISELFN